MRLGGTIFLARSRNDLEPLCEKLDCYGLSAIVGPPGLEKLTDDECMEYGLEAGRLGITIGEYGCWCNLISPDSEERQKGIKKTREALRKAEIMDCRTVLNMVGTTHPSGDFFAPTPYMFSKKCRSDLREIILQILDGLELKSVKYILEPWCNSFFYRPEDIREFIDSVGHPSFGLHLDQMNMISHDNFFNTTELINKTFDLLEDKVFSVHLKDQTWDYSHQNLKWDEVSIGDGVMDYDTYLKRISKLPVDITCYCERMTEERDFAINFARLHHLASKAGTGFLKRGESR